MTPASPALAAPPVVPPEVVARARPIAMAGDRLLPVLPCLCPLLPEKGLRRGSVVAVDGSTSLALALVAEASARGSWCAAVGVGRPPVSPVAAAELGVALERFPLVAAPAGSGRGGWPWVVAALLDALDVVVTWPAPHVRPADARRLIARCRERGAVLVVAGRQQERWRENVDLRLEVVGSVWEGIGDGHGRLIARRVEVEARGRGAASRPRRAALWLPGPDGAVTLASFSGAEPPLSGGFGSGEAVG